MNKPFGTDELTETVQVKIFFENGDEPKEDETRLVREHTLTISINGKQNLTLTCLNTDLENLIYGHLLTEGIINGKDEVKDLMVKPGKDETLASLILMSREKNPSYLEEMEVDEDLIFSLTHSFNDFLPVFEKTHATHCAYLIHENKIIYKAEDLSRHNACDKAIGHGLSKGINLNKCILFSSGRIPKDMAKKLIKAGIPLVVTKAVPTAQALTLSKKYGLTIIFKARNGSYMISQ